MQSKFRIMALTPVGLPDPAIGIAAARAGETGLLDLEHVRDDLPAAAHLHRSAVCHGANGDKNWMRATRISARLSVGPARLLPGHATGAGHVRGAPRICPRRRARVT